MVPGPTCSCSSMLQRTHSVCLLSPCISQHGPSIIRKLCSDRAPFIWGCIPHTNTPGAALITLHHAPRADKATVTPENYASKRSSCLAVQPNQALGNPRRFPRRGSWEELPRSLWVEKREPALPGPRRSLGEYHDVGEGLHGNQYVISLLDGTWAGECTRVIHSANPPGK